MSEFDPRLLAIDLLGSLLVLDDFLLGTEWEEEAGGEAGHADDADYDCVVNQLGQGIILIVSIDQVLKGQTLADLENADSDPVH